MAKESSAGGYPELDKLAKMYLECGVIPSVFSLQQWL